MTKERAPRKISHQKMRDLAVLPLFYRLKDRSVIVAGHDVGALWKTELLAATGAKVDLFLGQKLNAEHERIFGNLDNVKVHERAWQKSDLFERALAVAQSISDNDAISFVAAAKEYGVPVNIIDRPKISDFQFGAIVNRSPLVIGISTDGAAPAMGKELRGRLETLLPQKLADWLKMAAKWRPKVKALGLDFNQKRDFWHQFAKTAIDNPLKIPTDAIMSDLLRQTPETKGFVTIAGAGPGDPELLTLGTLRAMQTADVILVDDLVSQEILDFARREADIISVGKRAHKPSTPQKSIIELMIEHAKNGKNVLRLKGGDSLIFGRATEEIQACEQAGVQFKLIAGISAAQGVSAALGISMTDREYSRRVQFVTGSGKRGGLPPEIDFGAIADKDAATFVYMPRTTSENFVAKAIANGLSPRTPAAIICDGTRASQKVFITTIREIPQLFKDIELGGPEIMVIGNVLRNSPFYKQSVSKLLETV